MWFKENKWLLAALLVGGMVRALFLVGFYSDLNADPDAYKQIAENVRNQGVFGQAFGFQMQPTAYRPPLYPWLLSLMVKPDDSGIGHVPNGSVAMLHFALGLLTIFFAFDLARRFGLKKPHCFCVAAIVAIDPIALRHSSLVMTETLAVFFATIGLWLFSCRVSGRRLQFLWGGVVFGLLGLCRPTFLIWGGLVFLATILGFLSQQRESKRTSLISAVLLLCGILCVLAPWMIRNQQLFGKPIFATSHGGYTLFLGNNDSFYDYLHSGQRSPWSGEKELRETVSEIRKKCQFFSEKWKGVIVDEVKKDQLYYEKAMEVIKRRPADFCYACFVRVIRFWSIVPNLSEGETNKRKIIWIGSVVWYGCLFVLALSGILRCIKCFTKNPASRWLLLQRFLPALLLVIAFQGLHLVYWSNMRMRAPLVIVFALLAVFGTVKTSSFSLTTVTDGENENNVRK